MGSRCRSSPLNWDIRPSSLEPQPGDPSIALLSVEMRKGLGDPPAAMTFLISASLTLILLRLLLLGDLTCFPGRSFTVCVGEGDRDRCPDGRLTITIDWSSEVSVPSEWRSRGFIAGRGLSDEPLGGAVNTSEASIGSGLREVSLGSGGTGGGKASKSGELEYVAMDEDDGDVAIVRCLRRIGFCQLPRRINFSLTDLSRVLDEPSIFPRKAEVFALTDDLAVCSTRCLSPSP